MWASHSNWDSVAYLFSVVWGGDVALPKLLWDFLSWWPARWAIALFDNPPFIFVLANKFSLYLSIPLSFSLSVHRRRDQMWTWLGSVYRNLDQSCVYRRQFCYSTIDRPHAVAAIGLSLLLLLGVRVLYAFLKITRQCIYTNKVILK